MIHWYAFQSKPRKEQFLCEQLHLRQIETFFPCISVWPINARTRKVEPYFPRYVFGQFDLEEAGRSIVTWLPGEVGIVDFGGEPASVPDHLINMLKQHLETINASHDKASNEFRQGDVVVIHGGPFAGYEAIFNASLPGRQRVEVLLKTIQGPQLRLQLSTQQIASRSSAPLS